ncbi:MAG: hypothetical protein OXN17_15365 [Candidatus Poribacteria bacterium]|nr:hypothetical protein [Candidatus Poribacteria bacterium]
MEVWLPPAAIITVVIAFNTLMIIMFNKRFDDINKRFDDFYRRSDDSNKRFDDFNKRFDDFNKRFDDFNKRFDDLRSQMTREHDILAGKVDNLTDIVTRHITDYSIHNVKKNTSE